MININHLAVGWWIDNLKYSDYRDRDEEGWEKVQLCG